VAWASSIARSQLLCADVVLLNKADLLRKGTRAPEEVGLDAAAAAEQLYEERLGLLRRWLAGARFRSSLDIS
jgi:G3E family GTPase